jgi:hypothetical protein
MVDDPGCLSRISDPKTSTKEEQKSTPLTKNFSSDELVANMNTNAKKCLIF